MQHKKKYRKLLISKKQSKTYTRKVEVLVFRNNVVSLSFSLLKIGKLQRKIVIRMRRC